MCVDHNANMPATGYGVGRGVASIAYTPQEGVAVRTFTAFIEFDPETKLYVGIVPGIPGAHTQAASLDELQDNLKEVLELCLEELDGSAAVRQR